MATTGGGRMATSSVILGISFGHNTTACLLVDGKIVACASEERFNRVKNTREFPLGAVHYVLEEGGAKVDDIDEVHFSARNPIAGLTHNPGSTAGLGVRALQLGRHVGDLVADRCEAFDERYVKARRRLAQWVHPYFQERVVQDAAQRLGVPRDKVHLNDHHTCHAYAGYAFYAGKRGLGAPALILTLDAEGDDLCASVSVGREGRVERVASTPAGRSIGVLYAAITQWLGMKPDEHEYKVMGLAPYAPASMVEKAASLLGQLVWVDGLEWRTKCNSNRFPEVLWELLRGQRFDAVAGGVQLLLERLVTEWVKNAIAVTGATDLVLSGGCFMNVKANKVILEMPEVSSVTVCPSAGDESAPIGAAWAAYLRRAGSAARLAGAVVDNLYLGPSFSDGEIAAVLEAHRPPKPYDVLPLPAEREAETIAGMLADGQVVARFAGRMEFGARALGNRSILADPSRRELVRVINDQIKGRDFWMPFACTVADPGSGRYVVNPKAAAGPYMALAFDTNPAIRASVAAGIHPYDYTMRPQLLAERDNPRYYEIVRAFERRTGIGAVLNTSFNLHGEPVVCSPVDALHVFDESGLENLQLEHVLLRKRA
jgi:carbamoyltransferase